MRAYNPNTGEYVRWTNDEIADLDGTGPNAPAPLADVAATFTISNSFPPLNNNWFYPRLYKPQSCK